MNLSDLVSSTSKAVEVRNVTVTVTALSAAQSMSIHNQIPDPVRAYPDGLTQAEKDREDKLSGHVHAVNRARARRRCLIVAAAAQIVADSGLQWSRGISQADAERLADELMETLSEGELLRIYNAYLDLEYGTNIGDKDAPGN